MSNFCNIEQYCCNLPRYRRIWHLRLLFFYSTFLSPLTSLIDFFFSLLTICLFLPTSVLYSLDQIPSSSLNLKHLSLSLHLKSNPKIFFLLSLHLKSNSNSQFKTKPRNGIITNQIDLHPIRERTKESTMEAR